LEHLKEFHMHLRFKGGLYITGVPCFGPSADAARIESSKEFSKQFMTQFNIPTARWKSFTDSKQACEYIRAADFPALVVKASGLAAGKGVIVAQDKEEACQAAVDILQV
jgi:phosphoribosylamine--glycine ligase / phosphoribosylglycinamide formyltransferase / phosphoribosylformylglycinamidine cyclo-ligase